MAQNLNSNLKFSQFHLLLYNNIYRLVADSCDHPQPIFVLFPARKGGSKKGSLIFSWTDGGLYSGQLSYQNASLEKEPLY